MNKNQLKEKLFQASKNENIKEIKALIENGVCVNTKDDNGMTALCYAVDNDADEAMRFLIEKGVDNETALEIANEESEDKNKDEEIIKLLKENGAKE